VHFLFYLFFVDLLELVIGEFVDCLYKEFCLFDLAAFAVVLEQLAVVFEALLSHDVRCFIVTLH
jgi:hypothetical protein